MVQRRPPHPAVLLGVILLGASAIGSMPKGIGAQPVVPELSTNWQLLPRAPHGGRLIVTVTNNSTETKTGVAIDGTLPASLTMAGPTAVPTTGRCANALTDSSTICVRDSSAPGVPPGDLQQLVGQTLRLESEQLLVTAVGPGPADLVVARGVNGTQAASHPAGTGFSFMRPQVSVTAGGAPPTCVVGLPRVVGCSTPSLPPGGSLVVTVDVGRTPGASTAPLNLMLNVPPPQAVAAVDFRSLADLFATDVGPFRATLGALAADSTGGAANEAVPVRFSASFPETCEVAAGTAVNWSLNGWGAITPALLNDFVGNAPLVATLDGQPIATTIRYSNSTARNSAGQIVPTVLALWFAYSPSLAAGTHTFERHWGPTLANIEDGLDPTLPAGSVVGAGELRRVIATPPQSFPATAFPPCRVLPVFPP